MKRKQTKKQPGRVRDAVIETLMSSPRPLSVQEIQEGVCAIIGPTSASSVRSYLNLNTPESFVREQRGYYHVRGASSAVSQRELSFELEGIEPPCICVGNSKLFRDDCFTWLERQPNESIHAVVTDPPYGLHEYTQEQQAKLRQRHGGVWRIPPAFDGHQRSPLPRFTVLKEDQLKELSSFFFDWARILLPKLVPGANVIVASNPLLSHIVSWSLAEAGLERRGEIIRLVMTMRGGDRPKAAHEEFEEVSVMPRSSWEPWVTFRKPLEGRVQDNLRKWKTGGFRRPSADHPFCDVIKSAPTHRSERELAPHPSLKPQAFLRKLVRAVLPLGEGTICDPFAGSGSTLAAAEAVGYTSVGVEKDNHFFELARTSIAALASFRPRADS
ncbi:MAG: DNA methyltransferase [FCB group bacterium]|jgi:site-specific DNA-methyltransferase (adenine-specific)|nr:DNA methyltransferase [FCB group bacterium]